jgi:glycosyltransferase involved in cell wall biosynthesis
LYNLFVFITLIRERHEYDAVFTSFASFDTTVAVLAGIFTHKPVVCKIASSGSNGDIGRIKKSPYSHIVLSLLRRVTRFVALNSEVQSDLESVGVPAGHIVRIPNGVDVSIFRPPTDALRRASRAALALNHDTRLILGVGRLVGAKLWPVLIRGLRGLDRSPHDWRVILLGKGDCFGELEQLVHECGLSGRVHITDEKYDVGSYLAAADIFVLPSRREGLSNALIEAMASGIACLVSDVPGNTEAVTDGLDGLVAPPGDETEFGKKLNHLLDGNNLRSRLGASARDTAEKRFRIENVARSYKLLFESIAQEAPTKADDETGEKPGAASGETTGQPGEEPVCY